jgi:hypothetical protein
MKVLHNLLVEASKHKRSLLYGLGYDIAVRSIILDVKNDIKVYQGGDRNMPMYASLEQFEGLKACLCIQEERIAYLDSVVDRLEHLLTKKENTDNENTHQSRKKTLMKMFMAMRKAKLWTLMKVLT